MDNGKPRIVMLNRSFWPDTEATGQLLEDLCEHLKQDFDVHVICGQPNSPQHDNYVKHGIEHHRGITVHRLRHRQFAKRIPAGRIINLVSFTAAAARYLRRRQITAHLFVSETDPFLLPIISARQARRAGGRFVSYLQDIYPDVAEETGKARRGWLTRQIRRALRSAYGSADRVIVLGHCMRDRLAAAPWNLDAAKVTVIPNWSDCRAIQPLPRADNRFLKEQGLEDRFVVMHSGNMGLTQRLDVLVQATEQRDWPAQAILLLVGDGAARPELESLTRNRSDDRVRLLPYQPRAELAQSLSAADLHVVSMHQQITGCLCPSKLYGILAAGRPVLAIAAAATDLCQTVEKEQVGWCCRPGDPGAIARSVAAAAADDAACQAAGARARALACRSYDRDVVVHQFSTLFHELTSR